SIIEAMVCRGLLTTLCCVALAVATGQPLSPLQRRRIEQQVRVFAEAAPDAVITLGEPQPSEFPAFEKLSVTLEQHGKQRALEFLLARDRSRLLWTRAFDLTIDPYAAIMRKIDLAGRPARGPANAPVTVVLYDDLQCPFCAQFYITLFNEVMNRYRDRVSVVMKDFPLATSHLW